jgi:hypothetical protein
MDKELELLNIEIDRAKDRIGETTTGMTLLGAFFLTVIPLFYAMMGIYDLNFENIRVALILCIAIMLFVTMLSVTYWELNTKKLKGLYSRKTEIINRVEEKQETPVKKNKK